MTGAADRIVGQDCWSVYLVRCADGTLYCGVTKDLERRIRQHNGLLPGGARYTRGRRPVTLAAHVKCGDRGEALRLEKRLKKAPRNRKLLLAGACAEAGESH